MKNLLMMTLFLCVAASHADTVFRSGPVAVPMLEIFTSEGCSSCPPAEAWLNRQIDNDALWKTIVPVAWHVDYWDSLGWRDPFARAEYSRRQQRYVSVGHVSQPYTPGIVFAGREWRGYFQATDLPVPEPLPAGELELRVSAQTVTLHYSGNATATALQGHVALLGFGLETEVRRGENKGKRLAHEFVVLAHSALHDDARAPGTAWQGALPSSTKPATRYALVAWVAAADDPAPVQSTGGWLEI